MHILIFIWLLSLPSALPFLKYCYSIHVFFFNILFLDNSFFYNLFNFHFWKWSYMTYNYDCHTKIEDTPSVALASVAYQVLSLSFLIPFTLVDANLFNPLPKLYLHLNSSAFFLHLLIVTITFFFDYILATFFSI